MKYFFAALLFFTGAVLAATGMFFIFYLYSSTNYIVSGILLIVFGGLFALYAKALMIESKRYSEQMLADIAAAFREHNGILAKQDAYKIGERNESRNKVRRYFFLLAKSGDVVLLSQEDKELFYVPHYQKKNISQCPFCQKNIFIKEGKCTHCQGDLHLLQPNKS